MVPKGGKRYTICGALRLMVCTQQLCVHAESILQGESDDCINRLAIKDNILPANKLNPTMQL